MKIQDIVFIALFAAITAALGLLPPIYPFGLPVPITAQTLGVMLAGAILGPKRGGLSQLLFVLLVAAGLPLLAGGRGGLGIFATPSAGFVIAFPIAAFVIGMICARFWENLSFTKALVANIVGGIGVVYLIGIPVYAFMAGIETAVVNSVTYVPGDLVKAGLAASVAVFVKRGYPIINAAPARD